MADTIYLKDGSVECIFNTDDECIVLEKLIRNRLGDDAAERFKRYTEPYSRCEDEEALIIDELSDAIRDIGEEVQQFKSYLNKAQRISRKEVEYRINRIERIVDNNT